MGDLQDDALSFDLLAAAIRADAADLKSFVEALAAKLEGALPGSVEVKRRGGLFRSGKEVQALAVTIGDDRFELGRRGSNVEASVRRQVRGITLKTEEVALDEWIDRLAQELHRHAESSAQARAALSRLVQ